VRPTQTLLAVYLVVMLAPLLVSHPDAVGAMVAPAHLIAAAILVARRPDGHAVRPGWVDWFPLLLVPFLYGELPLLNQWAGPGFHDAVVQGWERRLLGFEPSLTWAKRAPYPLLSESLHAAYLAYYPLIYVPSLVLHAQGRARAFRATALALTLAFLTCYVVFVVFPVQGPRYLGAGPAGIPGGPVRAFTLGLLERGSSRGSAFPSSHVAVATVQAVLALRYHGRPGWGVVLLALGLAGGAVYGGFHYGVDALAGAVVGTLACVAALAWTRAPRASSDSGD
jgi:membrane-associated phospholipid phosphatase